MMEHFRIVIAGCGRMADKWAQTALLRGDCEIVGLVDIKLEYARAFAERHKLPCPVYTDLETAIQSTGAGLVFDVTVPESHYAISTTSLRLGCHVFSEKPLAATLDQAQEVVRLSRETGRTMSVMQNRRYHPQLRTLRQLLLDGAIGKHGFVGADFFLAPHFGGFRDTMDSPLLLDMAIHTFDQARYLIGADPVSVYGHEFQLPGSWYKGHASAVCTFEMSDGTVFSYRGSWSAEGAPTSWESSWRVIGERGTAMWDGQNPPNAELVSHEQEPGAFMLRCERREAEAVPAASFDGHAACLSEMFEALREGRASETDCADNIKSLLMVFGAIESARTGRKIHIENGFKMNYIENI